MATTQPAAGATTAPLRALVERHRDDIRQAVARHRGRRVRLFGSVARGEEREHSDIDLLVDFAPGSSLFDLLRLNRELEGLLRHPVDAEAAHEIGGIVAAGREAWDADHVRRWRSSACWRSSASRHGP